MLAQCANARAANKLVDTNIFCYGGWGCGIWYSFFSFMKEPLPGEAYEVGKHRRFVGNIVTSLGPHLVCKSAGSVHGWRRKGKCVALGHKDTTHRTYSSL